MKNHIWSIMGFCIATITGFIGCIIWQTMVPPDSPLEFSGGYAYAWNDDHYDLTISYHRDVTALRTTTAEVVRQIICRHEGGQEVFDLPPLSRTYVKGTDTVIHRLIAYPKPQPIGTRCLLRTTIKWWPTFSMAAHVIPMPDIPFVVQKQPE